MSATLKSGLPYKMTPAKVRLAMAFMDQPGTNVGALRRARVTLVQAAMAIEAEPSRLSELERGKRPDAVRYRRWLTAD